MGVGHSWSGFCAGLVLGNALMLPPSTTLCLGVWGAGAALLPDIDCVGSSASTAFGPFSTAVHYAAIEAHYMALSVVDPHGDDKHGAHRGFTHWWPCWILTGAATAVGCIASHWTVVALSAILAALAVRGMTIPEPRPRARESMTHHTAVAGAYWLLNFTPMYWFRKYRKKVNRTTRLGMKHDALGVTLGVGKIMVAVVCAGIAWLLDYTGQLPHLGPWLGVLVFGGQFLHWLGDWPTEMGVPGFFLTRLWRLPKWLAFKAGGPFEVAFLWIPMGILGSFLVLGTLGFFAHVTVMWWITIIGESLIALAAVLFILACTTKSLNRRYG